MPVEQDQAVPLTQARPESPLRWLVPLAVLGAIFLVATAVRMSAPPDATVDFKEESPIEIAQAALHGLACGLCLAAMIRSGRRQADFYWWVAPAFITFFMFWREAEIDSDWLGLGENAFTWKYLFEGHMPIWKRVVLGVPSITLALVVLHVCRKRARLLLKTVKCRHVRASVAFFVLGIGLYALAQVYDRAHYLLDDYGVALWGVRAHRDDFWEEVLELAGAAAIFMAVVEAFRRRPIIVGTLDEAERRAAPKV